MTIIDIKKIDIKKPAPSMAGLSQIRRVGKHPEEKPPEEKPTTEEKPLVASTGKKSFASRFVEIAVFDVKRKFGLVKEPAGTFQQKIRDFEKFEEFCKIARGER